jgi:D-amino-acid dehydrogenase
LKRVLVIGSGVIGLCSAVYCLRRGFAVTLVDREAQARRSCSFGNSGMIVPSHFVPLAAPGAVRQGLKWMLDPRAPFHVRPRASLELFAWLLRFAGSANEHHVRRAAPLLRDLVLASRACYEELAAQPDANFGLVREGLLYVCQTAQAFTEETHIAEQARALGMPAEVHVGSDASKLDPALRSDIAGAIYYPLDCHLAPDRLMAFLEAEVVSAGGRFLWETEIADWRREGNAVRAALTVAGDDLEADEFVLCGGAWSPSLVRDLGLAIPIQAGKGYSVTLPPRSKVPAHCAILSEARVAVTPMNGGVRIGGTMELDGLDRRIDARRVRAIIDAVSRYYRIFESSDFDGIEPWSGLRPCTPDGLPYIGRSSLYTNLAIAAGHAMMGISLGPVTGKIVSEIIAGETPGFDMAQLAPDRFR